MFIPRSPALVLTWNKTQGLRNVPLHDSNRISNRQQAIGELNNKDRIGDCQSETSIHLSLNLAKSQGICEKVTPKAILDPLHP